MLEARVEYSLGKLALQAEISTAAGLIVAGPNGSGKTTLLRLLLGARTPAKGKITLGGKTVFDENTNLPVEQRSIGYVPQTLSLFPHLSALENVAFSYSDLPRADKLARAAKLLERMSINSAAAGRRPADLSGGEKQRVALARALAFEPRALLLDEPFAALDARARVELRDFVKAQLAEWGRPFVLVTHDRGDAEAFDVPVVVMEAGRVTQSGTAQELRAAPATDFVRWFFA